MKLLKDFYTREDVVHIAKELLGKILFTKINGQVTAGIITETEAYAGVTDRASHAFNGRRTARTEIMYSPGGTSYVYLCYGIHHLFNVVTNEKDIPHAVLIRAIKPYEGEKIMMKRRGIVTPVSSLQQTRKGIGKGLGNGPGTVSQALGIKTIHTGISLFEKAIWIEDKGIKVREEQILKTPRIGVDYAGADALLPYRFTIKI